MTMMVNKIEWTGKATKQLLAIDQRYIKAIKEKVNRLVDFPQVSLDIKQLDTHQYRIRHGDYRIFFEVVNGVPKVIKIQQVQRRKTGTYKH